MPRITFFTAAGAARTVDAKIGLSLMEAAVSHAVAGIVAQCGGACACATCHVYVAPEWLGRLPLPEEQEEGMLELAWERRDNSRLSCQIVISPALDGLIVTVPPRQA
jgi:2Fe-2S ferredoxin